MAQKLTRLELFLLGKGPTAAAVKSMRKSVDRQVGSSAKAAR